MPAIFAAVTAADLRLETIGFVLASANASSCADRSASAGIVLRSLKEYQPASRSDAKAALGFVAPITVEAVVEGTPAAKAGLRPGDGLIRFGDRRFPAAMPDLASPASLADLNEAQQLLESAPIDQPTEIEVLRGATSIRLPLVPAAACRARFALILDDRGASDTDGLTVRIGARLIERLSDIGLAVVVAHELAHNILKHPAELERLKVGEGFAGEFGRSAREILRTEDEADRLSVHLLARAGYDPMSVAAFWRGEGKELLGILPRGPSHRGWKGRADLAEQEAIRLSGRQPPLG